MDLPHDEDQLLGCGVYERNTVVYIKRGGPKAAPRLALVDHADSFLGNGIEGRHRLRVGLESALGDNQ